MASTSPALVPLEGVVRHYAWGSPTAIPHLLGIEPDGRPYAELWLGAHPDDPAGVPSAQTTLDLLIAVDPDDLLGADAMARFGPRLPFLLKVLGIEKALSLQVHPDLARAREGFAAEDAAGVARTAPHRNYRDANHKPELVCALTPFEALCGFRPVAEILALFDALGLARYRDLLDGPDGLRATFTDMLTRSDAVLCEQVAADVAALPDEPRWAGVRRAVSLVATDFPGDVGGLLALLLNYVELQPGEAIYLGAGNVHAYLRGTGVEVMADSDNVLRCGLTPKHIDVPEVLRNIDFVELSEPRTAAQPADGDSSRFAVPVPDFALLRVPVSDRAVKVDAGGPRIVLCVEGSVSLAAGEQRIELRAGRAAFAAASAAALEVRGDGLAFVASPGAAMTPATPAAPAAVEPAAAAAVDR